jgi:hypothetical protein
MAKGVGGRHGHVHRGSELASLEVRGSRRHARRLVGCRVVVVGGGNGHGGGKGGVDVEFFVARGKRGRGEVVVVAEPAQAVAFGIGRGGEVMGVDLSHDAWGGSAG